MINKADLTSIISKYYLNGMNEAVRWDIQDNKLTIKIDPYPFMKKNKTFNIDNIKQIIQNINNIRGVVKFKVENPQMINVGI